MSESVTTSIRLSPRLRRALEQRAQAERRGKNWIVSQALEKYLAEDTSDLEAEARRQSLLASQAPEGDWAEDADFAQWK